MTERIFRAAGAVPTTRPATVVPRGFSWNYTTYLNIVFLVLFALLYWTYRNRERLGAGGRYARDPVCGMQVEMAHAPASLEHGGQRLYFCSDHCAERFTQRSGLGNGPAHDTETTTDPDEEHTMDPQRMMERLDAMVSNGRITDEEAVQLRATQGTPAFDDVVARIRARHAQAHTESAVADGTMRQEEADGLLEARPRRGALDRAAQAGPRQALRRGGGPVPPAGPGLGGTGRPASRKSRPTANVPSLCRTTTRSSSGRATTG